MRTRLLAPVTANLFCLTCDQGEGLNLHCVFPGRPAMATCRDWRSQEVPQYFGTPQASPIEYFVTSTPSRAWGPAGVPNRTRSGNDHTTARSRAEADGVKVLLQTVVGPLVQTMVERHWQTEMFGLWGVHIYRWRALPLFMPTSASYNAKHAPNTRQAHAVLPPWTLGTSAMAHRPSIMPLIMPHDFSKVPHVSPIVPSP